MKRLISLFLCVLFAFSLCACQQAAPSSSEAPDQQAITEEATEYFNQMMDGDFETFFNALPQGVQDNTSAEAIQETWEEEAESWADCRRTLPRRCPVMCRNTPTKSVLNLSFPVKRAISKCSSTIPRMAAFTTMSFGKMKQNKKERHLYE